LPSGSPSHLARVRLDFRLLSSSVGPQRCIQRLPWNAQPKARRPKNFAPNRDTLKECNRALQPQYAAWQLRKSPMRWHRSSYRRHIQCTFSIHILKFRASPPITSAQRRVDVCERRISARDHLLCAVACPWVLLSMHGPRLQLDCRNSLSASKRVPGRAPGVMTSARHA
jgi:hypothetical protein